MEKSRGSNYVFRNVWFQMLSANLEFPQDKKSRFIPTGFRNSQLSTCENRTATMTHFPISKPVIILPFLRKKLLINSHLEWEITVKITTCCNSNLELNASKYKKKIDYVQICLHTYFKTGLLVKWSYINKCYSIIVFYSEKQQFYSFLKMSNSGSNKSDIPIWVYNYAFMNDILIIFPPLSMCCVRSRKPISKPC